MTLIITNTRTGVIRGSDNVKSISTTGERSILITYKNGIQVNTYFEKCERLEVKE